MFLPPFNLPDGILLLITDELSAAADFVLHSTLAAHLKRPVQRDKSSGHERSKAPAVILSVSEDLGRWKALASKSVRYTKYSYVFTHPYCARISTFKPTWTLVRFFLWMFWPGCNRHTRNSSYNYYLIVFNEIYGRILRSLLRIYSSLMISRLWNG